MKRAFVPTLMAILFPATMMPYHTAWAEAQNGSAASPATGTADVQSTDNNKLAAPVADLSEGKRVRKALDKLIQAYETSNVNLIRNNIDPTMLGYQRFLDGVRQDALMLRQIRIHLLNTQVVVGPDVAVVQTDWQKRFLAASSLSPGMFSGHSIFLMHRSKKGWRMAAFSGDNLFASQSGTLGQINVVPSTIPLASVPIAVAGPPPAMAVRIEVIDPDLANRTSLTVQVSTGFGDRESLVLTATTPGDFVTNTLTMVNQSTFTPGNGIIEIQGATTLYVKYMDNNPGNNRPPSMLTKAVPIR